MAPTLLSIWDWPTRMRMLEARMETQKLSRMMERSDLMNLWQKWHGAGGPACPCPCACPLSLFLFPVPVPYPCSLSLSLSLIPVPYPCPFSLSLSLVPWQGQFQASSPSQVFPSH